MQATLEATHLLFWLGVSVAGGAGTVALRRWTKPIARLRRPKPKPKAKLACATILAIRRKLPRADELYELELLLRVEPHKAIPFLACPTLRVSTLQLLHLQPSKLLTVRYHPGGERQATVESIGYVETDQPTLRRSLTTDLAQAAHLNSIGLEASAIVVGFSMSGVFAKGDNLAAILDLKVFGPNCPIFSAKARGVFDSAYLHRFQPGNRICVRYDPKRPHLVAIDRAWVKAQDRA